MYSCKNEAISKICKYYENGECSYVSFNGMNICAECLQKYNSELLDKIEKSFMNNHKIEKINQSNEQDKFEENNY